MESASRLQDKEMVTAVSILSPVRTCPLIISVIYKNLFCSHEKLEENTNLRVHQSTNLQHCNCINTHSWLVKSNPRGMTKLENNSLLYNWQDLQITLIRLQLAGFIAARFLRISLTCSATNSQFFSRLASIPWCTNLNFSFVIQLKELNLRRLTAQEQLTQILMPACANWVTVSATPSCSLSSTAVAPKST